MLNSQQSWQLALTNAVTNVQELCDILNLDSHPLQNQWIHHSAFSLRVPRSFVARMEKGNPSDPLLMQVLPLTQELELSPHYCQDPLQEKQSNPVPGLLHKYYGRVLLIAASGCAIHCRYCFRRNFPYEDNSPGLSGWRPALDYIAKDSTISEVILSGGDPLILKDNYLAHLIEQLASIPHLKILRIHTRLPIVLPERITDSLITALTASRLQPVVVTHCNHPRELDRHVEQALKALRQANITLLNQFVLLRGINDNPDTLITLCQQLFFNGVLPYYLNLLDPVQGTEHFAVSTEEGQQLIQSMRARLPGYLVPKLVREVPGETSKVKKD